MALVGGEAGVGKTRLADQLAATANEQDVRVLRGGCVPLGEEGLPFAPVTAALRGLAGKLDPAELEAVAGPARADLGRLLPDLAWGAEAAAAARCGCCCWASAATSCTACSRCAGCSASWPATAASSGWSCPASPAPSWPSSSPACSAPTRPPGWSTTSTPARRATRSSPKSWWLPAPATVPARARRHPPSTSASPARGRGARAGRGRAQQPPDRPPPRPRLMPASTHPNLPGASWVALAAAPATPADAAALVCHRTLRKNVRTSPTRRSGASMAAKWPPRSNSDQCTILLLRWA